MSAEDNALSAYEAALTAAKEERQKEEAAKREADAAAERARDDLVKALMADSPLAEWFPGVEWDVMAYTGVGCSLQYDSQGREVIIADPERKVWLGLGRDYDMPGDPVVVHAVEKRRDSGSFEPYYAGPRVHGLAQIGQFLEFLAQRDAAQ